ncbi:hypothetical protein P7C73_g2838, partial [Tremellales sp. Uapishka_1]
MRFLLTSIIALVSSPLIHAASSATGYLHPARSLFSRSALHKRFASNNSHVQVDGAVCTVTAIGGGEDDGPNLLYAFNLCNTDALINLPSYYQVDTVLNTYLHNVEVRLTGGIAYKPDIAYWSPNSIYLTYQNATTYWFFSGDSVTFHGGGTIDANGQTWWDYFALNPNAGVAGGSSRTFARPIPLTVGNASNIVVQDISIINSPFWTNFVYQSKNITYDSIRIRALSSNASAPAANSDGWDIYRSDSVTISNSNIVNDDDWRVFVSFKPNCTNMLVENLVCNGSHGVSVGSLGQYYGEVDIVANILVRNISMMNAQNGARIKVFGGSNDTHSVSGGGTGYVNNVTYQDFNNTNVDNPILITQCYESTLAQCAITPATLTISNVHFINVVGTASGVVANNTVATLECSAMCQNITATGTSLRPHNGTTEQFLCANLANESLLDFNCTNVE